MRQIKMTEVAQSVTSPEARRERLATFLHQQISLDPSHPITVPWLLTLLELHDKDETPVVIRKTPGVREWSVKLRNEGHERAGFCYSLNDALAQAQHIYPGRRVIYAGKVIG